MNEVEAVATLPLNRGEFLKLVVELLWDRSVREADTFVPSREGKRCRRKLEHRSWELARILGEHPCRRIALSAVLAANSAIVN